MPLENRQDYLTLSTGKKFQVPFEQLIIFSTNLEPSDLVDEAFLRRIPYKIEIGDPDDQEFHHLFKLYAKTFGCEYRPEAVDYLLEQHYRGTNRPLRRCHPRDLLSQVRNYCAYNDLPLEMRPEYFDRVVKATSRYWPPSGRRTARQSGSRRPNRLDTGATAARSPRSVPRFGLTPGTCR